MTYGKTIVSHERSKDCEPGDEPMYPVRLASDKHSLTCYQWMVEQEKNVTFVGRLATYRYIDMDQAIAEAMQAAKKFIKDHT
jgi:UDP-galactopyranose mutase